MVRVHPTVPNQLNSSPVQRLFDTPDVFAPQKIQKALQMALRMVGLSRAKDGRWCSDFGPTPRNMMQSRPSRIGLPGLKRVLLPMATARHLDGNYHGFLTKPAAVFKNRVDPASRTTSMRCRLIGLTFAISILPVVANAQLTIDMGKITCDQYLAMPPAQSDNFSAWMSGWFSYQNRRTFVDILLHQKNIAIVKDWCKYHPTESVMSGLQKSLGTN